MQLLAVAPMSLLQRAGKLLLLLLLLLLVDILTVAL